MVNGILRNLARHLDELPTLDRGNPVAYLSLLYSHPQWLVEEWSQQLEAGELEELLRWDNSEPPVTVQVNTCRFQTSQVAAALEEEGMTVTAHPWLPDCLVLTGTGDLTQGRAWQTGMFYPQDPAARLAVLAAGLLPGNKVLDACAAPGGKSFAAAMTMGDQGELYACDLHAHKKALIEAGAARLGLGSITAQVLDARKPRKGGRGPLTRCWPMYPAPGWGSFAKSRRFAISPRKSWPDCPRCRGILDNVAHYVKPGGVLLYSTCTLRPQENEAVVRAFLASHGAFLWDSGCLAPWGNSRGGLYLWPQRLGTDGFFLAKFRRREDHD